MGKIPQHFIDGLMARVDIVEVVGNRVPLKKAGREFKACCPFHDEKTPSFHVVPNKQFYHCFGCGAHGTALGFLMDYEQLSFVEAVEDLAGQLGMDVPREQSNRPATAKPDFDLYELMDEASRFYQGELRTAKPAIEYLKKRGLSGAMAKRFAIGFAPKGWDKLLTKFTHVEPDKLETAGLVISRDDNSGHYDRFRNRIMFPIRDPRGRTIAFGGRVIEDENPKYLNSPETPVFHKGSELYGLYEARQERFDLNTVLMVEGYMDVVALHEAGIGNVVATLGTATTREHLVKLFRIAREVVFCFDGDNAGRKAAWRALETSLPEIRDGRTMSFLFLPDGHDPDSLVKEEGQEAFQRRVDHAMPLSEFLINHLSKDVDLGNIDGRARFAEAAKPLIQQIPNGIYRDMMIESVARAASVSASTLQQHIPAASARPSATRRRAAQTPPTDPVGDNNQQGSLIRKAISLIVHFPEVVATLEWPSRLEDVALPGIALLVELLEELKEDKSVHTAVLLERWRDRENGRHLARLASLECLASGPEQAGPELVDILDRLAHRAEPAMRLDELLAKSHRESLSIEEKQELKELLANR